MLHDSPLAWPLFPFKCPLFSSFLPSPSPPHLLPYANSAASAIGSCKNPGAERARSTGIFLEGGCKIKRAAGILLEGITSALMKPNIRVSKSYNKTARERRLWDNAMSIFA